MRRHDLLPAEREPNMSLTQATLIQSTISKPTSNYNICGLRGDPCAV